LGFDIVGPPPFSARDHVTGPVLVARDAAADCRSEARSTADNPLRVADGTEACVDLEPKATN